MVKIASYSYSNSSIDSSQSLTKCNLDLYIPELQKDSTKVLVYFHGGSWRSGDKSEYKDLGLRLCQSTDSVIVIPNYRLSMDEGNFEKWRFPNHLIDVEESLYKIFQLKNESLFKIHSIYLIGHSAGAQLVSMVSTINGRGFTKLKDIGFYEKLKGCICVAGIYDIPLLIHTWPSYIGFIEQAFGKEKESWIKGSPNKLENNNSLIKDNLGFKFLLVHGEEDELIDAKQTTEYAKKLKNDRTNIDVRFLQKGTHFGMLQSNEFIELISKFVAD